MRDAMKLAQMRLREKRASGEKLQRRTPKQKLQERPNSLRLAVNAKCVECMGGDDVPNFRKYIRECTSPDCPLYAVRPYQTKTDDEEEADEHTNDIG